ncbi:hypothetical protein [Pandoraea sp. 64-18]|uniref:hypothetical protein n=1 Tax=Pandoraea sp. 64-18 TaxID=1895806 RepID=UPI000A62A220|nr:hypothetical protein [Pandoraea sp. 64-18]
MNVWASVMVINADDARHGQAGCVQDIDLKNDVVKVKMDADGAIVPYKAEELRVL